MKILSSKSYNIFFFNIVMAVFLSVDSLCSPLFYFNCRTLYAFVFVHIKIKISRLKVSLTKAKDDDKTFNVFQTIMRLMFKS